MSLRLCGFDHISANDIPEPRDAMAAFARKWTALAAAANKGAAWSGSPELTGDLAAKAKQLNRQTQLLTLWAADDELWGFGLIPLMCDSAQSQATISIRLE